MNLSKHFKREEFACPHCGLDTIDYELVNVLETVREHFNKPVIINSGYRCPAHNAAVGGSENSQHLYGRAADIVVKDVLPEDVHAFLESYAPDKYGLGLYPTWVHIDTRSGPKARWALT